MRPIEFIENGMQNYIYVASGKETVVCGTIVEGEKYIILSIIPKGIADCVIIKNDVTIYLYKLNNNINLLKRFMGDKITCSTKSLMENLVCGNMIVDRQYVFSDKPVYGNADAVLFYRHKPVYYYLIEE